MRKTLVVQQKQKSIMSKAAAVVNKSESPTGWWLMKSEPEEFSIDELSKVTKAGKAEPWTGVRNYQARNFIRSMKKGQKFFFYHSNCAVPGVVGIGEICKAPFADPTQFEKGSKYYDSASKKEDPRWTVVDVQFVKKFKSVVSLEELKKKLSGEDCAVAAKGNRLSVMPVLTQNGVDTILSMAGEPKEEEKKSGSRRDRDE